MSASLTGLIDYPIFWKFLFQKELFKIWQGTSYDDASTSHLVASVMWLNEECRSLLSTPVPVEWIYSSYQLFLFFFFSAMMSPELYWNPKLISNLAKRQFWLLAILMKHGESGRACVWWGQGVVGLSSKYITFTYYLFLTCKMSITLVLPTSC